MASDLFWLYAVNIALGLVTLASIVVVGGAAARELLRRHAHRTALAHDDHVFLTPELGPMMADGGERLDKKADGGERLDKKADEKQPPQQPR